MPQSLRSEFKKAYGEIYTSVENIKDLLNDKRIISVGDIISYNLLRNKIYPKLMIIDQHEKKKPILLEKRVILETGEARTYRVENPAGSVTDELWNAIKEAMKTKGNTRIIINGEEDMAFLPAVLECEVGDLVLYGFFDKGFVLTKVNNDLKKKMKEFLSKFEKGP